MLGDDIERVTKATGVKRVVDYVAKKAGKDCGCAARKARANNPNMLINKIIYKNK
jgi:hypothetical protein